MTAYVGISCDGCGKIAGRTDTWRPSPGDVRREMRARGWHRVKRTATYTRHVWQDGRTVPVLETYGYAGDICPGCWAAGTR